MQYVQYECIRAQLTFRNHTASDRLTDDEINEFFREPLSNHIVVAVKGFFRRANLIPNQWKKRIGATHEHYTMKIDNSVQVQGLPGRMTGYWRDIVDETSSSFENLDIYGGINTEIICRKMPVLHRDEIKWIGIYVKRCFDL